MSQKTIRNLRIENFQSHELTEMAFDDGLNVIVGASDQGKSAVIRALRWLLFNEPRGSDFIRVGTTQCRVTIELADGSRVTRERTPSRNRYIVTKADGDEQIYEGFGNTVPKEVSDISGVAKVMLDEDTETVLHLGTQLEPPFLLSEPGSIKAKAIGRLNGVHIMDAASRDTNRDLTRANGEEKNYREQLAEVEAELEQFNDLPYEENLLLLVEDRLAMLKAGQARLARLQHLRKQYQDVQGQVTVAAEVLRKTEHLDKALLGVEQAVALQSKSLRLRQARLKMGTVTDGIAATDGILRRTEALNAVAERLQNGQRMLERYRRLSGLSLTRKQWQGTYQRVEAVLGKTEQLAVAADKVSRIEQAKQHLNSLGTMQSKLRDIQGVMVRVDRVLAQTGRVPTLDTKLDLLVSNMSRLQLLADVNVKKKQVERQLHTLERMLVALKRTERGEAALARLEELNNRQRNLMAMNATLFDLGDRLRKADVYLHTNALELTEKLEAYSRELKNSGTCPTCFAPIDEHTTERLLEEFRGGQHS